MPDPSHFHLVAHSPTQEEEEGTLKACFRGMEKLSRDRPGGEGAGLHAGRKMSSQEKAGRVVLGHH